MPYMYDVAAEIAGVPLIEFYTDAERMAAAQLELHERLGQDVIAIGSDNFYIAEGFGCRTTRKRDELPALISPAVGSFAGLFDLEAPDPRTDGRMPVMLEALRLVKRQLGKSVALRSPGTGPFALASYLVGTQRWLLEIAMLERGLPDANEEAVHHALRLATDALILFGRACLEAGADILHCGDSLASCSVISPATFERFSYPYCKQVFAAWHDAGAPCTLLHICGDSTQVLNLYAQTGADLIEIDTVVDLVRARAIVGDRAAMAGNLDTVEALLRGTPSEVRQAARDCIRRAGPGGRFLLGSGCLVPRKTPLENLRAMVEAARAGNLPTKDHDF
jgi:uroporphyrinogen decarboxylase